MPIERYRDPDTGRWVTRVTAEDREGGFLQEIFGTPTGKRESQEYVSEGEIQGAYGGRALPNWDTDNLSNWGERWYANRYGDDGRIQPLSTQALDDSYIPSNADEFRIVYFMPDNPDYPRGYGSTGPIDIRDWNPENFHLLYEPLGGTGIAEIRFRYL